MPVEIDLKRGFAWMRQLPPSFGAELDDGREHLARAASLSIEDLHPDLPPQVVSTGLRPLLVPLRDDDALRRAQRDENVCREAVERLDADYLYLFAIRASGDVIARMFDPYYGIGEDPATGSAAGPLGAYLASRGLAGMPGSVVIAQGEMIGRPSFLQADVRADGESWTVRVGGGVRIVGSGSFETG